MTDEVIDEMTNQMTSEIAEVERKVRELASSGDFNTAVSLAIEALGDEVYGYVASRSRDEDDASDVFAQACANLVTSMPTFQFRCTVRTWFYRLAKSAGARYRRSPANRPDRRIALSQVSEAVDHVRSRTRNHLRSEVKDGFRKLRETLDDDDQQLLLLRIDRDLTWNEIAEIVDDVDDPADIARAAARLRQQFQKLKDRLRELAVSQGLISDDEDPAPG